MLRRGIVWTTVLAGLASCAVLTVDVDIYKGPLANHEDVQMEQLAVMAVGAKPLLIRLRDDMEQAWRTRAKVEPWTLEGVVEIDFSALRSPEGRLVHSILGLYRSQSGQLISPDSRLVSLVQTEQALFDELVRLGSILEDRKLDEGLWSRANGHAIRNVSDLQALLVPPPGQFRSLDGFLKPKGGNSLPSSTAKFSLLCDANLVAELVAGFQVDSKDLDRELVERIVQIGRTFIQGREVIERCVIVALDIIIEVSTDASLSPADKEWLTSDAIDVASKLIQPKALLAALVSAGVSSQDSEGPLLRACEGAVDQGGIDAAELEVRFFLARDPFRNASRLRELHMALRAGIGVQRLAPVKALGVGTEFADERRRSFGIARGPTLTASESRSWQVAQERAKAIAARVDGNLEGGRLPIGLEDSIENYLTVRDAEPIDAKKAETERRRLLDGLIHFSEKILFVVGHDAVLRACQDSPDGCTDSYVMVLESIGNSILTVNDELRHRLEPRDNEQAANRQLDAAKVAWPRSAHAYLLDIVMSLEGEVVVPESFHAKGGALHEKHTRVEETEKALNEKRKEFDAAWGSTVVKNLVQEWTDADVGAATGTAHFEKLLEAMKAALDKAADDAAKKFLGLAIEEVEARTKTPAKGDEKEQSRKAAAATRADERPVLTKETIANTDAQKEYDGALDKLKKDAIDAVLDVRTKVLEALKKDPQEPPTRGLVHVLVREQLRDPALANSAALVDAQPVHAAPDPILPVNPGAPTEVLDSILATLKTARIAELAEGHDVVALDRAILNAERYRSEMVYIRPPASFLRNATPVSALQDNQLGWGNELTALTRRSLYGENRTEAEQRRLQTQNAIDKQFWQTINRVRVTGGGNTTYALVKDDIGNWYVKGYKGNPKVVVDGLVNMALAAASGPLERDLLARSSKNASSSADTSGQTTGQVDSQSADKKEPDSLTGKHVGLFAERYETDTAKDAKELRELASGLKEAVEKNWRALANWSDVTTLSREESKVVALIAEAASATLDGLGAAPTDSGKAQSDDAVDVLDRLSSFEAELLARVDEKKLVAETSSDLAKAKALVRALRASIQATVGKGTRKLLEQRIETVEDYQEALMVLGQRN